MDVAQFHAIFRKNLDIVINEVHWNGGMLGNICKIVESREFD